MSLPSWAAFQLTFTLTHLVYIVSDLINLIFVIYLALSCFSCLWLSMFVHRGAGRSVNQPTAYKMVLIAAIIAHGYDYYSSKSGPDWIASINFVYFRICWIILSLNEMAPTGLNTSNVNKGNKSPPHVRKQHKVVHKVKVKMNHLYQFFIWVKKIKHGNREDQRTDK